MAARDTNFHNLQKAYGKLGCIQLQEGEKPKRRPENVQLWSAMRMKILFLHKAARLGRRAGGEKGEKKRAKRLISL